MTAVGEFGVNSCAALSPMITGDPDLAITFTVANRAAMDSQLEAAVAVMQAQAMTRGRGGILVTRHGYNLFSVRLSDAVPFGLTLEDHDW